MRNWSFINSCWQLSNVPDDSHPDWLNNHSGFVLLLFLKHLFTHHIILRTSITWKSFLIHTRKKILSRTCVLRSDITYHLSCPWKFKPVISKGSCFMFSSWVIPRLHVQFWAISLWFAFLIFNRETVPLPCTNHTPNPTHESSLHTVNSLLQALTQFTSAFLLHFQCEQGHLWHIIVGNEKFLHQLLVTQLRVSK